MLSWAMIGAAIAIMAKAADMEERSSVVWGTITCIICVICAIIIPLAIFNVVIGLVISFLAMFGIKIWEKKRG